MAIKFQNISLTEIEFKQNGSNYFEISDVNKECIINVKYKPIIEVGYSCSNFKVFMLENNYLNAENDVFQILDNKENLRLGWIFPIQNLDGKQHNYYENAHLNKYKLVAFKILLKSLGKDINLEEINGTISILDIYPKDTIIFITSNENTGKIENFNLDNYLPSLSKYGYFKKNSLLNIAKFENKNKFCISYRNVDKLKLIKSNREISNSRFLNDLFSKHLKTIKHHLVRFHILYQIIEYFLSERFDLAFKYEVSNYTTDIKSKNDFIEKINNLRKERINIKKIIECLNTSKIKNDYNSENLERDCLDLLSNHNSKEKTDLSDLIYDVRNLIVHSYRNINEDEIELIKNINHELELLTINIIEKYCTQHCIRSIAKTST